MERRWFFKRFFERAGKVVKTAPVFAETGNIRYDESMNMITHSNGTDQEKAVPYPRRLDGPGEQTYSHQLGIHVPSLIDQCLVQQGTIRIMDIGGYHSTASADMAELLSTQGKPAEVTVIDLPVERAAKIDRPDHTQFIGGDLNDPGFLEQVAASVPKQNVLFMNQVTQYLQDRLGVIKFFFDNVLEEQGSFYVNIIGGGFIHGDHIPESLIVGALEDLWEAAPGVTLQRVRVALGRKTTHQYQLRKTQPGARLPVPAQKYSQDDRITESLVYVKTAYDFLNIRE